MRCGVGVGIADLGLGWWSSFGGNGDGGVRLWGKWGCDDVMIR